MSKEIHRFTIRLPRPVWNAVIAQKLKREEPTINRMLVKILREQCGEIESLSEIVLP